MESLDQLQVFLLGGNLPFLSLSQRTSLFILDALCSNWAWFMVVVEDGLPRRVQGSWLW